jgi:hypothetical protein
LAVLLFAELTKRLFVSSESADKEFLEYEGASSHALHMLCFGFCSNFVLLLAVYMSIRRVLVFANPAKRRFDDVVQIIRYVISSCPYVS